MGDEEGAGRGWEWCRPEVAQPRGMVFSLGDIAPPGDKCLDMCLVVTAGVSFYLVEARDYSAHGSPPVVRGHHMAGPL